MSVDSDVPAVNSTTSGLTFPLVTASQFATAYDGTNRLGNIASASASQSTPLTENGYVWVEEATLNVSQALRLPLMGVIPAVGGVSRNTGILQDTAENIALGLKAFTEGQVRSFSEIKISDDSTLSIDAATFKKLDNGYHTISWSDTDGLEVFNSDGSTKASIEVSGSVSELITAGLITSSGSFNTSLNDKNTNLVSQISTYKISDSGSTDSDIILLSTIVSNKPTGTTITLDLDLATSYGASGLSFRIILHFPHADL